MAVALKSRGLQDECDSVSGIDWFAVRLVLLCVVNRQVSKNLRIAVERAREFVNEDRLSQPNHHLGIGVYRLTLLVLVGRGDKYPPLSHRWIILCHVSSQAFFSPPSERSIIGSRKTAHSATVISGEPLLACRDVNFFLPPRADYIPCIQQTTSVRR